MPFFFRQPVLTKHPRDLLDADGHAAGSHPGGDSNRIGPDSGRMDHFHQDLDDQGGGCGRCDPAPDLVLFAAPRQLHDGFGRICADIQVPDNKELACNALSLNQIQQRVMDANLQSRLQVPVKQASVGPVDEDRDGVLEGPVGREADTIVEPQSVSIEIGDGPQGIVPASVAVTA